MAQDREDAYPPLPIGGVGMASIQSAIGRDVRVEVAGEDFLATVNGQATYSDRDDDYSWYADVQIQSEGGLTPTLEDGDLIRVTVPKLTGDPVVQEFAVVPGGERSFRLAGRGYPLFWDREKTPGQRAEPDDESILRGQVAVTTGYIVPKLSLRNEVSELLTDLDAALLEAEPGADWEESVVKQASEIVEKLRELLGKARPGDRIRADGVLVSQLAGGLQSLAATLKSVPSSAVGHISGWAAEDVISAFPGRLYDLVGEAPPPASGTRFAPLPD